MSRDPQEQLEPLSELDEPLSHPPHEEPLSEPFHDEPLSEPPHDEPPSYDDP